MNTLQIRGRGPEAQAVIHTEEKTHLSFLKASCGASSEISEASNWQRLVFLDKMMAAACLHWLAAL